MTIPGNSSTSASAEPAGWRSRAWIAGVGLYALAFAVDFGAHLAELRADHRRIDYPEVAVTFSASLFWPIDLVARALLAG